MKKQYKIDDIRQLENSLSKNPKDTDLMNKLAIGYLCCEEADSFNKVDVLLKKAFEINPSIKTSNNYAFYIITEWSEYDEGIEILKPFVDKEPKSYMPYNLIGYAYLMKDNYEQAKLYLTKAKTLCQTEMVEVIHNLAVCENHLGNPQKALPLYEKSIAIMDSYNESKYNKAVCHFELRQTLEIDSIIQEIIKSEDYKDAPDWVSNYELSLLYYLQGDLQNAYDFLIQNPSTPDLVSDRVSAYFLFNYDKPAFQQLVNKQVVEKEEWIRELHDPEDECYYEYTDQERFKQTEEIKNEIQILKNLEFNLIKPPELKSSELYMSISCGCMFFDCKLHGTQFDD